MDSETRYRQLFEAAQDGILILDINTGRITDVNPFLATLMGYTHEEMVRKTIWDIGLVKDIKESKDAFERLKAEKFVRYEDLPLMSKDGRSINVEVVSNVYLVDGKQVVQCNIRDCRHRKDADDWEERHRQTQKMEALGQLAGGLAHDFNNLLGVILGYCEVLQDQLLPEPTHRMISEINNAGISAKNLSQRLLAFSRRQALLPVVLNLNEVVRRLEKMLSRLIGDNVELVSNLADDAGMIRADPGQVEQVLMNLVINARDAMTSGGKIQIATSNAEIDEIYALQHPSFMPGNFVVLSVSDTGTGIDAEILTRIFEPFFSTKPAGQGTGLGLSTVYGIVKQGGGAITVYSEPGAGATFRTYFPRSDEAPDSFPPTTAKVVPGGNETVLLVDDADPLRELTQRLLEDCGYTVLSSGDPAEALRIAEQHSGSIPLLITDMMMVGFSGSVLAARLAEFRPETKVLYASGHIDHSLVQRGVRGKDYAFLEKPFSRDDLLRKVRDLLDAGLHLPRIS